MIYESTLLVSSAIVSIVAFNHLKRRKPDKLRLSLVPFFILPVLNVYIGLSASHYLYFGIQALIGSLAVASIPCSRITLTNLVISLCMVGLVITNALSGMLAFKSLVDLSVYTPMTLTFFIVTLAAMIMEILLNGRVGRISIQFNDGHNSDVGSNSTN